MSCLLLITLMRNSPNKKMIQLFRDKPLREKLRADGLENVKKYSWAKTAQETLDIYRGVLNS